MNVPERLPFQKRSGTCATRRLHTHVVCTGVRPRSPECPYPLFGQRQQQSREAQLPALRISCFPPPFFDGLSSAENAVF